MDLDALYKQLLAKFDKCVNSSADWRELAEQSYNLYHGNISDYELAGSICDGRPNLIINRVKAYIDSVLGLEINNKRVFKYSPRKLGKAEIDEKITAIGDWFRQESNASAVDSLVFTDCVIAGIGWLDIGIDYNGSIEGRPYYRRLNPFNMYWDPDSDSSDLSDIKYAFYKQSVPLSHLKDDFPKADIDYDSEYDEDEDTEDIFVDIIECRYKKNCKMVRLIDPIENIVEEIQYKDYLKLIKEQNVSKEEADLHYNTVTFRKELIHQAFMYNKQILEKPRVINLPHGSLGWIGLPAFYDNVQKMHYGLVKNVIPIQRASNALLNEVLYTASQGGHGGYIIEQGAIPMGGEREFSATINSPKHLTIVQNGGLGKIQPKPMSHLDNAKLTLVNVINSSFNAVMGISEEFLGIKDVNQPGVLEEHRKQSSLNILGRIFGNLQQYRREQGRLVLHYIRHELSNGRLIHIINGDNPEYIKLERDVLDNSDYEIIVSDSPVYLNDRERTQNNIGEVLPLLEQYMNKDMALLVLEHSNLPSEFVDKVRGILNSNTNVPDPMQQVSQELEHAKSMAELDNLKANTDKTEALAQVHTAQAMSLKQEANTKAIYDNLNNALYNAESQEGLKVE